MLPSRALEDSTMERNSGVVVCRSEMIGKATSASGLAHDGHILGVATKEMDVLLDPVLRVSP